MTDEQFTEDEVVAISAALPGSLPSADLLEIEVGSLVAGLFAQTSDKEAENAVGSAHEEATRVLANATRQAEAVVIAAEEQAARLVAQMEQTEELLARSREEATRVLANATRQAEAVVIAAEEQAARLVAQMEQPAVVGLRARERVALVQTAQGSYSVRHFEREEQLTEARGRARPGGRPAQGVVGNEAFKLAADLTIDDIEFSDARDPFCEMRFVSDPILSLVNVTVVIPTLNEADNMPHVFARMPREVSEIILVDGNSTDDTVEVAKRLCPGLIVVSQTGKGRGNALACGFWAATGDVIVMLDGDGSTDPAEIPRFVAALLAGADFAKGSRFTSGGGSADITKLRRIGNWGLAKLVNQIWGRQYTDLCYGYNAFWRRCLPFINPDCEGFEVDTLINVRAARARLRVHEVPSFEYDRRHGASNLSAWRDGKRILRTIIGERVRP